MTDALAILEDKNPIQYFTPKGLDPIIEKLKEEVAKFVPDISTEEGRKEVASFAYKIAKSKTAIDNLGKQLVASEKERIKAVDAERARAWDVIEQMQKAVRKPLTDWEERDERRIAEHKRILEQLRTLIVLPLEVSAAQVQRRLDVLATFKDREFEEFTALAKIAMDDASIGLTAKLAAVEKAEADRIELERLQKAEAERHQRERDEKLQAEAAARAKAEAEARAAEELRQVEEKARIERERLEAEQKAEAERVAKEKAKAEAELRAAEERARKAEEEKVAAAKKSRKDAEEAVQRERDRAEAEKQAELQAAAKREADKAHRGRINRETLEALKPFVDEDAGKRIIEAIAKGQVPHLKIGY